MNPITVEIALEILRALNRYGPEVAADITAIFKKKEITAEDWERVFNRAKTPFAQGLLPGVLIQETSNIEQPTSNIEQPELKRDGADAIAP